MEISNYNLVVCSVDVLFIFLSHYSLIHNVNTSICTLLTFVYIVLMLQYAPSSER